MSILFIFLGLGLLVIGGDFLVRAAVGLSLKLKLSKMIIGLTVVSFATSAPELLVSVQDAIDGFSDISLGNVIGSNIANIGLVLGVTAIITPLSIDKYFYKFNWPVLEKEYLSATMMALTMVELLAMTMVLMMKMDRKLDSKMAYWMAKLMA